MKSRSRKGSKNNNWKGGRLLTNYGYVLILMPEHPRADQKGYVREHIFVAEKILGKPLPPKAVVHHINEDKTDNRPENLVICQDRTYHFLLHRRKKALQTKRATAAHKKFKEEQATKSITCPS